MQDFKVYQKDDPDERADNQAGNAQCILNEKTHDQL